MFEIFYFCLVGTVAGFLAGFLGIGGGVVVIPSLLFYFSALKALPDPMRIAIGTTLCSLVGSAFASSLTHYRKGSLIPHFLYGLIPGGIGGAFIGVMITVSVPEFYIKLLFACFQLFVGIHFWRTHKKEGKAHKPPSLFFLGGIAFGVSILSAMLGIGGGVFAVPLFCWLGLEMRKAIGTSSILTFIILLSGALSFVFWGSVTSTDEVGLWGDIYYSAIPPIMLGSILFAPIGAHLAYKTPSSLAKRIFGSFLIIVGFYLGYSTLLKVL